MAQKNILIFKDSGLYFGSLEKLLQLFAKILSSEFNVFFAYAPQLNEDRKEYLKNSNITLIPFKYRYRQIVEPYKLIGMSPSLEEIIVKNKIDCIYTDIFANYQFPINSIPASIPIVLISPFGHFFSNGNVAKIYVSGKGNLKNLSKRSKANAEVLYNPLEDFPSEVWARKPTGSTVTFGRIGRDSDQIFDPIAVYAFKKLEELYGSSVKYIVVSAPEAWQKLARELKISNMEFRQPITDKTDLANFYAQIDVLAHARKDGETVGMAIAEAMLSGSPILTHRSHFHNDHFDILDGSYAKWSEADDVEGYFENMKWMVEHKDQIRSMGLLARKRALEIFSLERQAQKIILDFKQACLHNYNNTFFGKIKGYTILYWNNFKAIPFRLGKFISYKFPRTYPVLKKIFAK